METKQIRSMRFNGLFRPLHQENFTVIPTKELCNVYLKKPNFLASKGVINAQSTPPHYRKTRSKSVMRYDEHNSNAKPKIIRKNENSDRRFSPLGFGSDSCLRDSKKNDNVVRQVSSKLMVSTSRDLCSDRVCNDLGAVSKDDDKEDLLDFGNGSSGCETSTEEVHQPSPVSVLEPVFNEDMLEDGIEEELETMKSDSDCCGMEVSSDEESETEERKDTEPVLVLSDSSYVDDILAEVVLGDFEKRDFLDLVITPKIFEKLEKKYYIATSWKRSERRLLFDRVISGLVEVVESFRATPTWKKPVSRRLGTVLSTCGLKEELWKVLDRQEKRAKKELLGKVPVIDMDEWLEREVDNESVVRELESMILDELLDELVSSM